MAPPQVQTISICTKIQVLQLKATRLNDTVAFDAILLAQSNLVRDSMTPAGRPCGGVFGCPIIDRPSTMAAGLVGFPSSYYRPLTHMNSCPSRSECDGYRRLSHSLEARGLTSHKPASHRATEPPCPPRCRSLSYHTIPNC